MNQRLGGTLWRLAIFVTVCALGGCGAGCRCAGAHGWVGVRSRAEKCGRLTAPALFHIG